MTPTSAWRSASLLACACITSSVPVPALAAAPPEESSESVEGPEETSESPAGAEKTGPKDPTAAGAAEPVSDEASSEEVGPPPDSTDEQGAEWWFNRGIELGQNGDLPGAAAAFKESVELFRSPVGLYNLAVAYEYAEQRVEAIAVYREYIGEVGAQAPEAADARAAIDRLLPKVGTIELRFDEGHEPEQIFVDDKEFARDDFPLLVEPGRHEVAVVEKDGQRRDRSYELGASQVWTVGFARAQAPEVRAPPPTTAIPIETDGPVPVDRRKGVRAAFYPAAGLTLAAGIGIGVFGGLVLREQAAFEATKCGNVDDCQDFAEEQALDYGADHERRFGVYKTATNVMIGVGSGLAVVTVVLGVIGFSNRRGTSQAEPRVGVGPGSFRLRF